MISQIKKQITQITQCRKYIGNFVFKMGIVLFLLALFLASFLPRSYASLPNVSEFLCQIGLKLYQQGRFDEALQEFEMALLAQPGYPTALKYINLIEGMGVMPAGPAPAGTIDEILDFYQRQIEMGVEEGQIFLPERMISPAVYQEELVEEEVSDREEPIPPQAIYLDASLVDIAQPLEIEQTRSIVIIGSNIARFLVTEPDIITVDSISPNELLVSGNNLGYTWLHIWDDQARWTMEFLTTPYRPEGPSYGETLRRREELARNFKLRYNLGWSSLETGRRIYSLDQNVKPSFVHSLGISGESPYGNIASNITLRKFQSATELTSLSLGLTEGKWKSFKDFSLHAGDFSSSFSNLSFPGVSLRGVSFISPAFNKKLEYDIFWGREGAGRFSLSPELYKSKHSFLEGANLSYSPFENQAYRFSLLRGYGRDREDYLNDYGYDATGNWSFERWAMGYELAYDSETFAHLLTTHYMQPSLKLDTELRNISKDFLSIIGTGWRQGELGGLLNLIYTPNETLNLSNRLDIYRDRLYPAEDNRKRWNEDFECEANYSIDPLTNLALNYTLYNRLGRLYQSRYQNRGLGISRTFQLLKDIYTSAAYSHQDNQSFSSPTMDYLNDRIDLSLRFSLIGDLYYYINKEFNWLREQYSGNRSQPNYFETGLNWSGQFGESPLYGNARLTFHDEEETHSTLSFLSGEDYIEGYSELTYRHSNDKEIYGSCRLRNSWADNPDVTKRVEANFNAGMRYVWDTGLRWDAVCNIEGYIFKDLNFDGLRERDEPPVEGIRVWLGKSRSEISDTFGYYKFKDVRGRKAYVNIDLSTVPEGFLLTVPASWEVSIAHHQTINVDFGIMSRSEIKGIIFADANGNGEYDIYEEGITQATVTLEDGSKVFTDAVGRYSFDQVPPGEHTITLDLNSLPIYYLPKTAISKKIVLFEGMTYVYNIPLNKVSDR